MRPLERQPPAWRLLTAALAAALARAAGGGSVLAKGVTRSGMVPAGGAKYFQLQLACPDTAQALQLQLTALQGNPDLYVSTSLQQPGPDGFTWRAATNGSDALTLDAPDAGMYYVAVHGVNAASFKLQARVSLMTGAAHARARRRRARAARRRARAERAPAARPCTRALSPRARQAACPAPASACWTTTRRWSTPAQTSASCWRATCCSQATPSWRAR